MNYKVLAIDPGNIESGYVLMDSSYKPLKFGKVYNEKLLELFQTMDPDYVVIEMIGHYGTGMPAGTSVFDTCVWIGRFTQYFYAEGVRAATMKRGEVKMALCGTMKAKDPNITQSLVDRFAPNIKNYGKGTKKKPGFFYGFKSDIWAAYAVGVTFIDKTEKEIQDNGRT